VTERLTIYVTCPACGYTLGIEAEGERAREAMEQLRPIIPPMPRHACGGSRPEPAVPADVSVEWRPDARRV
jgi:hypothetical protein